MVWNWSRTRSDILYKDCPVAEYSLVLKGLPFSVKGDKLENECSNYMTYIPTVLLLHVSYTESISILRSTRLNCEVFLESMKDGFFDCLNGRPLANFCLYGNHIYS